MQGWNADSDYFFNSALGIYGYGKSIAVLLILPFKLILAGKAFDHGEFIGLLTLVFIPVAFLDRRHLRLVIEISFFSAFYFIFWFFGSEQARFLMPVILVMALPAAMGCHVSLSLPHKIPKILAIGTILIFLLFSLTVSALFAAKFYKVVTGVETPQYFLIEWSSVTGT